MFKSTLLCLAVILCMAISELEAKAILLPADNNTTVNGTVNQMIPTTDENVDEKKNATFVDAALLPVIDDDSIHDDFDVLSKRNPYQEYAGIPYDAFFWD